LVALGGGCADQPPTGIELGPDQLGSARGGKIRGGGFDMSSNVGSVPDTDWPPEAEDVILIVAPDIDNSFPRPRRRCAVLGRCAVGNIVSSFGGLGVPSTPDPNPAPGGGRSTRFAVASTTNFFSELGDSIVTTQSAIVGFFTLPRGGWQLRVDLAFLTGERGAAAQNDFAAITIISGDTRVEVLRLEADDPLAWKPEGCGSSTLGRSRVRSRYPRCTDWTPYAVDVSRFGGQDIQVDIRVREGGPDNDVATTLAFDNLKFVQVNLRPAVGPISLSPTPVRAGRPVQATSGFTDGDARDTHRAVWTWGDGTSTDPATLTQGAGIGSVSDSHTYSQPGTYTITLTVTDNDGGRGRTRRRITVQEP
jgi:hypothetical protein